MRTFAWGAGCLRINPSPGDHFQKPRGSVSPVIPETGSEHRHFTDEAVGTGDSSLFSPYPPGLGRTQAPLCWPWSDGLRIRGSPHQASLFLRGIATEAVLGK